MKDLKEALNTICESLNALAEQVKTAAEQLDQKKTPAVETKPHKKSGKKMVKAAARKKSVVKKVPVKTKESVLDTVFTAIGKSEDGITTAAIQEETGFDAKRISNSLYKLKKQGKVKTVKRGVYTQA